MKPHALVCEWTFKLEARAGEYYAITKAAEDLVTDEFRKRWPGEPFWIDHTTNGFGRDRRVMAVPGEAAEFLQERPELPTIVVYIP